MNYADREDRLANIEFKKAVLDNGLTVLAEINPNAKSVALGYFVKVGSRDETPEVSGVSHFLEHMLFKGSKGRGPLEVNQTLDDMGAQYNAYTSEENTVYYGAVLPEFAGELLELWTDLMRPALRQEDFETEKQVILEEIALYQDRPSSMLVDWGRSHYFAGHPLGNSVLGSVESINGLELSQMQDYYSKNYSPSSMVLAVAGKIDWDWLVEQVQRLTQTWKPKPVSRTYPVLRAKLGELREAYPKAMQSYIALMAPGVSAQDHRRYAAHMLANILGEGDNSRLHWALTDKGLVEYVGIHPDESDRAGIFMAYAQTDPANEEQVKAILLQELTKAEQGGITTEELLRAKNKLATGLVFAGETPMQRLMGVGLDYVYNQSYTSLSEIATRVADVNLEDIHKLLEAKPFSQSFIYSLFPA
jgi:predicted Zn-dependent peptidase